MDRIPELRGEIGWLRARTSDSGDSRREDQAKEQSEHNCLDQGVSRGRVDFSPPLP